jgi:amidophosphoribosyltransferase
MGVDMATYKQLIAHRLKVEEIRQKIGADSLDYLSLPGMLAAVREGLGSDAKSGHCSACFSGEYPVMIPEWLFDDERDTHILEGMWG